MKNIVSNLYSDYLRYTDRFRAIPWEVDMLKPVERRSLLSIHESARTKFVKTAKVIGHIIGNYHPHGDLAVKDVLTNLVHLGFAEGQGNWGNNNNMEFIAVGAARYTEIRASKFLDDGFSEFLDFVPWEDFEYEKEPHFLPFYLPIGLIGSGLIQGISLNTTKIPRYNFNDLLLRLYEILTNAPRTTIKPNINGCDVYEDFNGAFESILAKGDGIFYAIPKYKIIGNAIYIYGKAPHGFSKLLAANEKAEETTGKEFATIIDNSSSTLEVIVSPKKGNIDNNFIERVMNLAMDKIHVKANIVDANGTTVQKGIDEILLNTYTKWKECYLAKIQKDLSNLQNKLHELNVILVIRDIIKNNPSVKTITEICELNTSSYLGSEIESICSKYRIKTLIEANIDIPGIQVEIIKVQTEITNLDTVALKRIENLLGK